MIAPDRTLRFSRCALPRVAFLTEPAAFSATQAGKQVSEFKNAHTNEAAITALGNGFEGRLISGAANGEVFIENLEIRQP